jgi:replicative DNA helicase
MIAPAPTSEILDRLPPQNLDAERWVIGSCILDPRRLEDVTPLVRPDDFYADAHRRLYGELLRMESERKPIDVGLLVDRLKTAGEFEAVGGAAFLAEVLQGVPHSQHAAHYAAIVARLAKYRRLIQTSVATLQKAYGQTAEPEDLVTDAETALHAIVTGDGQGEPVAIRDATAGALTKIEATCQRQRRAGVLTGLPSYDAEAGGLFPGELVILAARPGVGKTALACQIAHHVGQDGRLTYYATMEMSAVELVTRTLCAEAAVSSRRVRTGVIQGNEYGRLVEAGNQIAERRIVLHDHPRFDVATIRRACLRLKRQELALVVVDYLQILTPRETKGKNRYEQVGELTHDLKALARELDVPVLVPTQLGREADKERKPQRPRLSQLRESGNIEADADVVWLLWRPAKWTDEAGHRQDPQKPGEPHPSQACLLQDKCRNGPVGQTPLVWDGPRTTFCCRDNANMDFGD